MKKHFLIIFILFVFFVSPLVVKADFGDLRYEITDVEVKDSKITFKGWAFIHKTNNFTTIVSDDKVVATDGGQMIAMQAIDSSNNVLETKTTSGSDEINYNFYCELFYKGYYSDGEYYGCRSKDGEKVIGKKYYEDYEKINTCENTSSVESQCYYEDLYFSITFDTSGWSSDLNDITFKIAASNNFFEKKKDEYNGLPVEIDGNYYTKLEDVSISRASVSNLSNHYIEINPSSIENQVKLIASQSILMSATNTSEKFVYAGSGEKTTYASWGTRCNNNSTYFLVDAPNYLNGRSKERNNERCEPFLGNDCRGSYNYLINVSETYKFDNSDIPIACPVTDNSNGIAVVVRGSHVKPSGKLQINIKNDKKCTDDKTIIPNSLQCNNSGTLSSTCDELTVNISGVGSAVVKIEQTGTVSSIMTPGKIYNGGGFNFGIMYQNNIKWHYVGTVPGNELHNVINLAMNDKLKDYDTYIASINISNLKLGDNNISSGMVKQCFSSSTNKNYYGNDGLTVTCIFSFPSSTIGYDGKVDYQTNSSININNKYYTSFDMSGDYNLTATIVGMDRIKESTVGKDSEGSPWTGNWLTNINEGCVITIYPLLYSPNFIYRPIDINNPFPNRNAGINWYDWINVSRNVESLKNTYNNRPDYTSTINNIAIQDIKEYNKDHNYLKWDSIDEDGNSSFINTEDYIKREGGS